LDASQSSRHNKIRHSVRVTIEHRKLSPDDFDLVLAPEAVCTRLQILVFLNVKKVQNRSAGSVPVKLYPKGLPINFATGTRARVLVEEKYLLEALESGDKAASAEEVPQARQRIAEGKTAAQKFACSIK
jgi:hypothetical protein